MHSTRSADVKFGVKNNCRFPVVFSTGPVEDAVAVVFNLNLSNWIDLNIEHHMHLIPELDSADVKFDVYTVMWDYWRDPILFGLKTKKKKPVATFWGQCWKDASY